MQNPLKKGFTIGPCVIPGISCILLMCQAYFIVPLHPALISEFNSPFLNLGIPAFIIPFATTGIAAGFFSNSIKPGKCFLISLVAMAVGTLLLCITTSTWAFLLIRALTGLATGLMLPLALIAATQSDNWRQSFVNMITILFSAGAGITFAPSLGGWLNGLLGWRLQCLTISVFTAVVILFYLADKKPDQHNAHPELKPPAVLKLIRKNRYIYSFAYLTGVFHSSVFVWISSYFTTHYLLDEFQLANTLFILGFPGLTLAILMYCYGLDKKVIRILYAGLGITITGVVILTTNVPLPAAQCLLLFISFGFCCSQPLFFGLFKMPVRRWPVARSVAITGDILFLGYGTGPLITGALLESGTVVILSFFILLILTLCTISPRIWKVSPQQSRRNFFQRLHNQQEVLKT